MYERVLHTLMTVIGILIRNKLDKLERQGRQDRLDRFFEAADKRAEKLMASRPPNT